MISAWDTPIEAANKEALAIDPFLAIDWGTTNRRIYRFDRTGSVEDTERDDMGIAAMTPGSFASEMALIRARFGDLPVICAGMVGSNRGWVEVPYIDAPADLNALSRSLHWVEAERTAIVPGVAFEGAGGVDVMRGEEVQLLGAIRAGLTPDTALLCQPGTHCKWAWMEQRQIAGFATAITGELFQLIRRHSLLSPQLQGAVTPNASFEQGLADAQENDLLHRLFAIRADMVAGRNRIPDPTSYASGLIIGTDVQSQVCWGQTVFILGDAALGDLYCTAVSHAGANPVLIDSHQAFIAGILAIWRSVQ